MGAEWWPCQQHYIRDEGLELWKHWTVMLDVVGELSEINGTFINDLLRFVHGDGKRRDAAASFFEKFGDKNTRHGYDTESDASKFGMLLSSLPAVIDKATFNCSMDPQFFKVGMAQNIRWAAMEAKSVGNALSSRIGLELVDQMPNFRQKHAEEGFCTDTGLTKVCLIMPCLALSSLPFPASD